MFEFKNVITRNKFGFSKEHQDISYYLIRQVSEIAILKDTIELVPEDPDDNLVLATALYGKANYIVSGDPHILNLRTWKKIKIVTAKEFLDILKK